MIYITKFGPVEITSYAEKALLTMSEVGTGQFAQWVRLFKEELDDRARSSRGMGEPEYHWLGAEADASKVETV